MNLQEKYPLLGKGYDELECVNCDTVCYPVTERSDGTIDYNTHVCKNEFEIISIERSFSINIDGELIYDGVTI